MALGLSQLLFQHLDLLAALLFEHGVVLGELVANVIDHFGDVFADVGYAFAETRVTPFEEPASRRARVAATQSGIRSAPDTRSAGAVRRKAASPPSS